MNIINKNRDLGKYLSHYLTLFSNNISDGQLVGTGKGPSIGGGIIFKYDNFAVGLNVESLYNNVDDNVETYVAYNFDIFGGAELRYTATKLSVSKTSSEEISVEVKFQTNYKNKFTYDLETKKYNNEFSAMLELAEFSLFDVSITYGFTNDDTKPKYVNLSLEKEIGDFMVEGKFVRQLNLNKEDFESFSISYL